MNGKEHVMCLVGGKDKPPFHFAAATGTTYNKWFKTFKSIKEMFDKQKQLEKEQFKQ